MSILKQRRKKQRCKAHREYQYLVAINGVIEGRLPGNYATLRWMKLRDIRK